MRNNRSFFPLVVLVLLALAVPHLGAQTQTSEVKFGEVTDKFVRNMKLLRTMTDNPELGRMMEIVVKKAEDLQSFNNDKNADEKRFRIMKQMDVMLNREGIQESDQKRLEKLQAELRALDPDGNFQKARSEMNRSISELQKVLGQIQSTDTRTDDILRLIRMHLSFYSRCLSKITN